MLHAGYVCVAIIHRSDMDHGIFNVHIHIRPNARDCPQGCTLRTSKESLHWKLTRGRKSLAAPGNRTWVCGVTVRCSTNCTSSQPQPQYIDQLNSNLFSVQQLPTSSGLEHVISTTTKGPGEGGGEDDKTLKQANRINLAVIFRVFSLACSGSQSLEHARFPFFGIFRHSITGVNGYSTFRFAAHSGKIST